jgi:hypothetical protein
MDYTNGSLQGFYTFDIRLAVVGRRSFEVPAMDGKCMFFAHVGRMPIADVHDALCLGA